MELTQEIYSHADDKELDGWLDFNKELSPEEEDIKFRLDYFGTLGLSFEILTNLYDCVTTLQDKVQIYTYKNKNDELAAFLILELLEDNKTQEHDLCVRHLIVNPNLQHQGIGTKVLASLESFTFNDGSSPDAIWYSVHKQNRHCLNMLNKLGYECAEYIEDSNIVNYKKTLKEIKNEL